MGMFFKLVPILLLIAALCGCNDEKRHEEQKMLFNTLISVIAYGGEEATDKAVTAAFSEAARIDIKINSYSAEGDINKINTHAGEFVEVSDETIKLLSKAKEVSVETGGSYDISIAPLFDLWGFDKGEQGEIPATGDIEEALSHVGYKKIVIEGNRVRIEKGMKIEPGSFLKGYAIKRMREVLKEKGIKAGYVNAVSSIEAMGVKPDAKLWRTGVQNPDNPEHFIGVIDLKDKALGVSGDYQTYIEVGNKRYHHILDINTGFPVEGKKMVVVVAEDAFTADLYSTALFTVSVDKAMKIAKMHGLEIMIIDSNDKRYMTQGFKNYFKENK